jgi:hypothetical protein
LFVTCALIAVCAPAGGAEPAGSADRERSLRAFLQRWAGEANHPVEESTRYWSAWVRLRKDHASQVIVYVQGRDWCGSGGCKMLVLEPMGETFRLFGDTTITRPPIRILSHMTNGWRDISVHVEGGGIIPGYDAVLPFVRGQYTANPTVPPARKRTHEPVTATVITGEEVGQPLFGR